MVKYGGRLGQTEIELKWFKVRENQLMVEMVNNVHTTGTRLIKGRQSRHFPPLLLRWCIKIPKFREMLVRPCMILGH